ncbi:MAG TPA: hypothetical protein VF092_16830 [Longimicrobium sp.]
MSRTVRSARRWALSAAVAASLGFGAAQAMASPTAASANARACDPDECAAWCDSIGGVGSCVGNFCRCIL